MVVAAAAAQHGRGEKEAGGRRRRGDEDAAAAAANARAPWAVGAGAALAVALGAASAAPTLAIDSAKVGSCVLQKCQVELARCLADEKCLENLVCLQGCNGRPDETGCQVKCGDLYADAAVGAFNTCAVTNTKCVPQKADDASYPEPPESAVLPKFDPRTFEGRYYIVAGRNELFDTFDCQEHYFTSPSPDRLFAKVNWRVTRPNGQWYARSDLQKFVQNPSMPGKLENHGNVMLHYQDDWYIVDQELDNFIFVYYRGSNDAWDGYGGAVVYARSPKLDPALVPRLAEDAQKVGLKWEDFTVTDNTCGPEPPLRVTRPVDLDTLADDVVELEREAVGEVVKDAGAAERFVEQEVVSFGPGFTVLKNTVEQDVGAVESFVVKEEEFAVKEFKLAEDALLRMERKYTQPGGPLSFLSRIFSR